MSRHYFIAAAALLGLIAASCSKNDVSENTTPDNAIGFGTYSLQSKAATDLFVDGTTHSNIPNGKAIGVYGYVHNGSNWATDHATATPNIFNNVPVTAASADGTLFNYSPSRYWPANTTTVISFYAYYPQSGAGITPAVTTGMGSYAFETQALAANQVDFLVSDLEADQSKTNGKPADGSVDLKFHHMLCQVKATADASSELKGNSGYKSCTVTKIEIVGVNSKGTLTPANTDGVAANTTFTWTGQNTVATYTAGDPTDKANILLLMPQTLPSTAKIKVTYNIVFNYSSDKTDATKDVTYSNNVKEATLPTAAVLSWEKNKIYNYTIAVNLDRIEFTSSVTAWDATETNVSL